MIGKIIKWTVRENSLGQTEGNISDSMLMIKNRAMEFFNGKLWLKINSLIIDRAILGLMDEDTKDFGKMASNMVKGSTLIHKVEENKVNGTKARELDGLTRLKLLNENFINSLIENFIILYFCI